MKVLMFGWEFPPYVSGGLGTACFGITKGLANHGVEVTFVLPSKRKQKMDTHVRLIAADEIVQSGEFGNMIKGLETSVSREDWREFKLAPYYTHEYSGEFLKKLETAKTSFLSEKRLSVLDFSGNYGKDLYAEVSRYALIGEYLGAAGDFDVIHAHDWLTYLAGVAAKRASGKPLVVHMHATEFDRSGEHINQAVYDIERYGLHQADKIIAVSHYTRQLLIRRYGVPPEKVEVVHNAVSKDRQIERLGLARPLKEKLVLFLGRVTMQKGPDYFIEAANIVLKKMKNVRFVMAGSGDMLPRMITRAAALKISDRFHFIGFLNRRDVEKMYALSDLYVMPSVSEPFGITPFEALLYDVPIIISRHAGVAEVLKNAVLVDFWDVHKLAEKIILLIKNPEVARSVVENCRQAIQNIEWDAAGEKIRSVYQRVRN